MITIGSRVRATATFAADSGVGTVIGITDSGRYVVKIDTGRYISLPASQLTLTDAPCAWCEQEQGIRTVGSHSICLRHEVEQIEKIDKVVRR